MALSRRLSVALASSVMLVGCAPQKIFSCATDDQCVGGGAGGVCEPSGYCSFADAECSSGRRYGELASADLAGVCLGAPGSSGSEEEPAPVGGDDPVIDPPGTFTVECESGTLAGALFTASDTAAFLGAVVEAPADAEPFLDDRPQESLVPNHIEVSIPDAEAGTYYLWIRMLGRGNSQRDLYAGADPFDLARLRPSTNATYQWVGTDVDGERLKIELSGAEPHVMIGAAHPDVSCDRIVVTDDPIMVPPGCSDCSTVGLTVTRIQRDEDDATEDSYGVVDNNDLAVHMGARYDNDPVSTTGAFRFSNVNIPAGAQVKRARIQFAAEDDFESSASLQIAAERGDRGSFINGPFADMSTREPTNAQVGWQPSAWEFWDRTSTQQTPDLSEIATEAVSASGFERGDALTFFVWGSGARGAIARDDEPADAAELSIEWRE